MGEVIRFPAFFCLLIHHLSFSYFLKAFYLVRYKIYTLAKCIVTGYIFKPVRIILCNILRNSDIFPEYKFLRITVLGCSFSKVKLCLLVLHEKSGYAICMIVMRMTQNPVIHISDLFPEHFHILDKKI